MTTARVRLSRDRVLAAAVALADREGAEALTVRRLAEDLGVHPTSLYNHVASKGAILDGVIEVLFSQVAVPATDVSWEDWVRAMAAGLRDLARAHPGAFMVLTRRPAENRAAYDLTELGLDAFRRDGFSARASLRAVRGISLALLGLALNECPPMGDWVDPGQPAESWEHHPRIREVAAEVGDADDDGHWQAVVEALVAGLRAAS